ncbi:MAG: O-antigen ligase family protein, partial [Anaerolineae bacterium]|nr:O-antigen ligase family protein [Anaerolineae bacterium]
CVNTALEFYTQEERDQALAWIEDGGFRWVRQRFNWAHIEETAGTYDWTLWDEIVTDLDDRDISILAVLTGAPTWAGTPPDPDAFASFARAFAQRYRDALTYYQIWHNPNIGDAWGGRANVYAYTDVLAQAAQEIRAADSDARIVLGSLAPNSELGDRNFAEDIFLDMLYAAGADPYFDIVSVQPYGFDTGPKDRSLSRDVLNFSRAQLVHQVLLAHDDGDKAVWSSHLGWNSLPDVTAGVASIWGSVDEATQAAYTVAAYNRAADEWPWMGLMCVNGLQPRPAVLTRPVPDAEEHWGFALIRPDGQPRPIYTALQSWAAERDAARVGVYPADTPYAVYEGEWTLGPQGADIGQSGDQVSIDFEGTGLALTVRRGPYRAFLYATVDGHPAADLPVDREGNAYIVLYDPLAAMDTVILAQDLSYGTHRAVIVAERGWGQWALVDWRVLNRRKPIGFILGLSALTVLGLAGAGCMWVGRDVLGRNPLHHVVVRLWTRCAAWLKALISLSASALYLFASWHLLVGDGLFRRLGDHGDWLALILSSTLFYFSPWLLLTLIAGTVVLVLVLLRPSLGLALTMFAAPLYLHPLSLFGKSFALSELVLLPAVAGGVLSLVSLWKHNPRAFKRNIRLCRSFAIPVVVFVVYGLLNSMLAQFRHEALREWRLVVLEPALFFFSLAMLPMDKRQRLRIVDAFIASTVMVALVGLVQYFWLGDVITAEGGIRRLRSLYGSPNNVGLYLGRVFPVLLALILGKLPGDPVQPEKKAPNSPSRLSSLLRWSGWHSLTWSSRRLLYLAALVPVTLALVLSLSRGAILLGVPAAVLFLGFTSGKSWRRITLIALMIGVLALIPVLQLPRFAGLLDFSSGTTGFRVSLWHSTVQMIRDHPLFGVGLDNFLYAYRTRYVLPTAWEEFNLSHPHNLLLDFTQRLGLPGLALLVWMQVVFWRTMLPYVKSHDRAARALALGFMASMVNFLAHGLVDAAYFIIDLAYVFMLTAGVSMWLRHWQLENEVKDEKTCT